MVTKGGAAALVTMTTVWSIIMLLAMRDGFPDQLMTLMLSSTSRLEPAIQPPLLQSPPARRMCGVLGVSPPLPDHPAMSGPRRNTDDSEGFWYGGLHGDTSAGRADG